MQNQPCQKINHVYQGFLNTAEGNSILWPIYCSEHKISARLCRTSSEMEHWSAILWNNTFRLYRGCTILPRCYSPYIICCNSKPASIFSDVYTCIRRFIVKPLLNLHETKNAHFQDRCRANFAVQAKSKSFNIFKVK